MTDHLPEAPPSVSLREYLETLIAKETGVIMQRLSAMDVAHTLQATELARRLEELNHAHARSLEDRGAFLTREIFDKTQDEVRVRIDATAAALNEARGAATASARFTAFVSSLAVGIVVLMVNYFLNGR